MAVTYEPKKLLTYFLRRTISELPRKDDAGNSLSARQTNATETFSGDDSTTTFTVSNTPLVAVNSVSVGGTEQKAYVDYTFDIENNDIIFTNAPATGTDNISVDYEHGSNWIYYDEPRVDLNISSYPRLAIIDLDESHIEYRGIGETSTRDAITLQVDVLAHTNQYVTIDGKDRSGPDVAEYYAREVVKKVKHLLDDYFNNQLHTPRILSNVRVPFEENLGRHRRTVDVRVETFDAGESTT